MKKSISSQELFNKAIEAVRTNNLFFIDDIPAFIPCSRSTIYSRIMANSDKSDAIKKELEKNRIRTKSAIRHRLFNMDNPTAQIALYRMLATPEERDALSLSRTDITSGGKALTHEPLVIEVIDSAADISDETPDNPDIQIP